MKHRFFITGGMGYIGSELARHALKQGHDVALFDSLMYEQDYKKILKDIARDKKDEAGVKLIIGDTRNRELLEKAIKEFQPTFIFHLAELSSVWACDHNPPFTEDINYRASKNVIDICEKLKIPVIYNSTSSLYGNQKEIKLMKEGDPLPEPTDNYCKYKLKMETYIKERVEKNPDFKIIVFRPATVFGLSPRMRLELLPNHFTYCAVSRGLLKISELNAYRAAIDIRDLIKAYLKVIERGNWKKLIYNIGHHNLSKMQFGTGIQSVVKCKIGPIGDVGDLRNLQIDSTEFYQEFDYHPQYNYEDTIKEVADWIENNLLQIEKSNYAGIINMSLERWLKLI